MALSPLDMFKYSGVWYEVANVKSGIPLVCFDTRGLYEYDPDRDVMDVQLGCRQMGNRPTAVKGFMRCPVQKGLPVTCSVRFPNAPYVPPSMYRILDTDYESYALVEGADDKSFVQVLSRYERPGLRFIDLQKERLKEWGYDPDSVHISPVTISEPRLD